MGKKELHYNIEIKTNPFLEEAKKPSPNSLAK